MTSLARSLKTVAVAALALTLVAGCTSNKTTKPTTSSQAPQTATQPTQPQTPTRQLLPGQPVRVALLLPLSGSAAGAGEALLNAAQLALFDVGDQTLELIVKDTGDTAQGAASAMQAASAEGAQIVLGPLFGAQIEAVTPIAQSAGINVISFSNDESKADGNVFIMGLSPRAQAKRVVGYAAAQGMTQVAVIAPNTAFGAESLAGAREVPGAAVVASILYDTNKVDLSEEVRALGSGFNVVLAPDTAKRMIGLGPLLVYYDIDPERVQFLGSSLWEDPMIGTEPNLQGAWFPAAAPEAWALFGERYVQAYGGEPPRIAGLGYDGVALVATLVRNAREGRTSEATATKGQWIGLDRNSITSPSGFAGVDGIFRFRADGRVEYGLAVLEVQRDGFPVVDPAPASFAPLTN